MNSDTLFAIVFALVGLDCNDPMYLCSGVETHDAIHVSVCAFPTDNRVFLPMPWKVFTIPEGKKFYLQTTNCTDA